MSDEKFNQLFESAFPSTDDENPRTIIQPDKSRARSRNERLHRRRFLAKQHKNRRRLIYASLLALLALGVLALVVEQHAARSPSVQTARFRAALVDELSATMPDPSFVSNVTSQLVRAGYSVDYYAPDRVTVGLFRSLPSLGYGLIIFRDHTAWSRSPGISIVTSELYSSDKYVLEQLTDQLDRVSVYQNQDYFAVTPVFVRDSMQGVFPGSSIVVMGCDGLAGPQMAQAFLDKGAAAYTSWDGLVTIHTDTATLDMVHSLARGMTLSDAVNFAKVEAGPDPTTHSSLAYYDSTVKAYQQFANTSLLAGSVVAMIALALLGPAVVIALPRLSGRR